MHRYESPTTRTVSVSALSDNRILKDLLRHYYDRHDSIDFHDNPRGSHTADGSRKMRRSTKPVSDLGVDVLIVDLEPNPTLALPDMDAIPSSLGGTKSIIIARRVSKEAARFAAKLGFSGIVPRSANLTALTSIIMLVASGEKYFGPFQEGNTSLSTSDDRSRLTDFEREVLRHLCLGESNKLIARNLNRSEASIKMSLRIIFEKIDADNRTHAAMIAVREGILM
jgi:DNA-binding NarL/FixJ family response regulator